MNVVISQPSTPRPMSRCLPSNCTVTNSSSSSSTSNCTTTSSSSNGTFKHAAGYVTAKPWVPQRRPHISMVGRLTGKMLPAIQYGAGAGYTSSRFSDAVAVNSKPSANGNSTPTVKSFPATPTSKSVPALAEAALPASADQSSVKVPMSVAWNFCPQCGKAANDVPSKASVNKKIPNVDTEDKRQLAGSGDVINVGQLIVLFSLLCQTRVSHVFV